MAHSKTFLTRGRTWDFDFKWRSCDNLKLLDFLNMIFNLKQFQVTFGFNFHWLEGFSKFILFGHMHMQDHDKTPVLYIPHQNKSFAKYRWRTYSRWQITLIFIVSSSGMTYTNMVSIPTEEHNRYMTYITTYPPSGAYAFNVAWTALHTLQERIHVLRKWPQDNPRSPHPTCAVMTSCTMDTQPLLYDRDRP
jgi:hypothetical protein